MARLLCIGGPNVGHYEDIPDDVNRLQYTSPLSVSFVAPESARINRSMKVHNYERRTVRIAGQDYDFLVHCSLNNNWLLEVIERYAKRYKRTR